jgi:hypothetical protein
LPFKPGVRCATPGCVVERLRRKENAAFHLKHIAETWVMTRALAAGVESQPIIKARG